MQEVTQILPLSQARRTKSPGEAEGLQWAQVAGSWGGKGLRSETSQRQRLPVSRLPHGHRISV